jgi:hypothetical protein
MKKMLLLMLCGSLFATSAFAKEQTHDGFFLRLAPGFGHMETKGGDLEFDDANGFFSLMLGGAISENLILHLDVASAVMKDPSLKTSSFSGKIDDDVRASFSGLGMTYYLMPANVYVSASVGSATTRIESQGKTFESDSGLGVNLMVGKEWWVSDNWGLGIAGRIFYANCDGGNIADEDVKTLAYGLLFSATYN